MTVTALTSKAATPPMVRGACPALSAPMMTGDGFLARIGLNGVIRPSDLIHISELAERHGNGLIDISARGNIQVRGLSAASARLLEEDVHQLNLPLRDGLPVETSALAGLDPTEIADPEPLARTIREFIAEHDLSRRLAAKFAVVVDGGGLLPLHGLLADIRLVAVRRADALFWQVLLGGTANTGHSVGLVADKHAKTCVTLILARIAAMERPLRGRELDPSEIRRWLGDVVIDDDVSAVDTASLPFGLLSLKAASEADNLRLTCQEQRSTDAGGITDTFAARIGIPFGQCPAERLMELGRHADAAGITSICPAIDHSFVFFGSENACRAIIAFSNDLILSENDPRAKIAACPGKSACNSASFKTYELGDIAARENANLLDGSFTLHLSGCSKGCAHPAKAFLNLVGMNEATALIFEGKTSDMPLKLIRHGDEAKTLAALATLVRLERGTGETTRDCLLRLGPARLEQVLSQGLS